MNLRNRIGTALLLLCMMNLNAGEPDKDIIALWRCDEGTGNVLKDSSGNGCDGEFIGNPAWGKGVKSSAAVFDGNSFVRVGARSLDVDKTMTIEAWIKPENKNGRIVMKLLHSNGTDLNFTLCCRGPSYGFPGDGVKFGVRSRDEKVVKSVFRDFALWDGRWHYLAAVCDGNLIKLYVDGRLDFASVIECGGRLDPGIAPLFIGGYGGTGMFKGMIDEISIWKRALSGEEIKKRYEEMNLL